MNVEFFHRTALPHPARLLQGTGKFIRVAARVAPYTRLPPLSHPALLLQSTGKFIRAAARRARNMNVGFFHGAALPHPARLLQGTGKFMRAAARVWSCTRLPSLSHPARLLQGTGKFMRAAACVAPFTQLASPFAMKPSHKRFGRLGIGAFSTVWGTPKLFMR